MAQFDESKVISPLRTEKAEIGKKYWFSDELVALKEAVEKEKTTYELYVVKKGYPYPFTTAIEEFQFLYPYEEPKYRPYVDTEEMINDFCERSGAKRSKMGEPFIWVEYGKTRYLILDFGEYTVGASNNHWTMKELFDEFTYCDGTPIGKLEN